MGMTNSFVENRRMVQTSVLHDNFPEGKQLAFDGRGRSRLASAGILDDQEHRGLLCWAIERDSGDSCNLQVDQVSADISVDLKLQCPVLQGSRADMPDMPD